MDLASCPPDYDWAKNSQKMDPCSVASKLINDCGTHYPLEALTPRTSYPPLTKETQTSCTCFGPVYALVSACADCQGGIFDTWKVWSQDCSYGPGTPFQYLGIIPAWASDFNVLVNLTYDRKSARALASPLASSVQPAASLTVSSSLDASSTTLAVPSLSTDDTTPSPTSSVPPITTSFGSDISTTGSQNPTAIFGSSQTTDQASSGSLKKSNHAGAIAGGVVGGLVFLVAIGAFLFWWLRRRRRLHTAPSAAYIAAQRTARPPTSNGFQPGLFDERVGSPLGSHAYSSSRAEKYRDDDKSTSTYSGGPLAPEAGPGGSRES